MRMIKFMAPAVLAFALLAGGCGDDSGGSPLGPGGDEEINDILEDLADGSVDSGDLTDLQENVEQAAEELSDSGSGSVAINDDTIEFTSEICSTGDGDFSIEGPGTSSDGTPVWVSISLNVDTREERLEYYDESILETVYGDADPIRDSELVVDYGRTELFGDAADDLPSFNASGGALGDIMDMTTDGSSASGSGEASDDNLVAGEGDATFAFTFTAACS